MKRSRRVLLLLIPLLLLLPLGVLQWRLEWQAEHPPASKVDKRLQGAASQADTFYLFGRGPLWDEVTHLQDNQMIVIRERKLFAELLKVLRLDDAAAKPDGTVRDNVINIEILNPKTHGGVDLEYYRSPDGQGSLVTYGIQEAENQSGTGGQVKVRSRFGPRFEALVGQLAQRAQAKGKHPEVVIEFEQGF